MPATATTGPIRLTPEQWSVYRRNGYVVVEDLLTVQEVEELRLRLSQYTHGGRPTDKLAIQIEPRVQRGQMKVEHPGDGIRKIDGLVENDDLFRKLGLHDNIVGVIEQILGPDLKMYRNTVMLKPPGVGSAKGMHQDSPYWPIQPMDLCSCWFALDDATPENGCMGVLPGWHRKGALAHVSVPDDFVIDPNLYDMGQMVMAPVRAGGGLFFHSLAPHYTAPNTSRKWRRAMALAYMSSKSKFSREGEGPVYFPVKGQTYPDCVR